MEKAKILLKGTFTLISALFILLAFNAALNWMLRYSYVKMCYNDHATELAEVADEFHDLYVEGLIKAKLIRINGELELEYALGENGGYSCDRVDCPDSNSLKILNEMWEKHHTSSDHVVYPCVTAYYDSRGRMMLYILVKCNRYKKGVTHDEHLIYMDDGYSGRLPFANGKKEILEKNRYKDNWYYWLDNSPIG